MCGIAGVLLPDGQTVDRASLAGMQALLRHRGPDSSGLFVDRNVGFAHLRLSIIDLSDAGSQPMSIDGHVLSYNGEIYNYLDVRRRLENDHVAFRGTSDTEVLLQSCIHYGIDETLRIIEGMFAFSYYDPATRIVYLCRDRLGIKPLHWTYCGGTLVWASEVKAMSAATPVTVDPIRALYGVASVGDHSNDYTVFRNVFNVPPGTYLACEAGQPPKTVRYFDILREVDEREYRYLDRASREEVEAAFADLLARSVRRMLMSDAPMGAFVSGGLDSSLIAAMAVTSGKELNLFTADVAGQVSEVRFARKVAEHLGLKVFEARFDPQMMIEHWAEATWHHEAPIVSFTNAIPFAHVAKLAHERGVKPVLTGEGADELFLGYPRLLFSRYRSALLAPVRATERLYETVPGLREFLFPADDERPDSFLNLLVQNFERQRLRKEGVKAYGFLPPQSAEEHYLTLQYLQEHIVALMQRNDRMGMLASIESRFPFLDDAVVKFALNVPIRYKIHRGWRLHNKKHPFLVDKALVRSTAERFLPDSIAHRRKLGFPMYGHKHVRVRRGFFSSGYVGSLLGMSASVEDYLLSEVNPYLVGKLASVEVFGRLFDLKESPEQVTEDLRRHVSLVNTN